MKIFFSPFFFSFQLLLILNEPPCTFPLLRSPTFSHPTLFPGRFQFFSRNRAHAWPGGAPFNEIKNKQRRNVPARNTGEQVVRIDGTGRRPPANYPCRLYASSKGARARVTAFIHHRHTHRVSGENRFRREKEDWDYNISL